ncbi:MAG: acyl-CoA synthetase [Proteobacteria bacterium]|nr:acyl-CoA synthetase [Pseudomonadota bacterium]
MIDKATPVVTDAGQQQAADKRRVPYVLQIGISIAVVAALILSLPTVVLLFLGLLPALVAFIVDDNPRKYAAKCVVVTNFAGAWFFLLRLWTGDHSLTEAMAILTDVYAWLLMYSAAALGWLCYLWFPSIAALFMEMTAGRRIAGLKLKQKKLIEEWGEGVVRAPAGNWLQ